jgi:hypothetical protein
MFYNVFRSWSGVRYYVDMTTKIEELNAFIEEREAIRVRKESGQPWPWTDNPIFLKWKFCNVRRSDDKCSRWVMKNWMEPHADDPDLWFALVVARRVLNWPASMAALGYPVPWDPAYFTAITSSLMTTGQKCYDTAYQLLVQGQKGDKAENMIKHILNPLWEHREHIRPRQYDELRTFFNRLSAFKYMGLFYTGQVVADLKYAQLTNALDWDSFAVPGPGSERGLNRVLGRPKNTPWKVEEWYAEAMKVRKQLSIPLDGQDTNNVLCEFDKMERIKLGEGRVRPYHPCPPAQFTDNYLRIETS